MRVTLLLIALLVTSIINSFLLPLFITDEGGRMIFAFVIGFFFGFLFIHLADKFENKEKHR